MAKPSKIPTWATDGGAAVTEPSAGKRAAGWIVERPSHRYFNWLFNMIGTWLGFVDSQFASDGVKRVAAVDDLAALKALVPADGEVVRVGSAVYVFKAGDSTTADDVLVVADTGNTGRWLHVAQPVAGVANGLARLTEDAGIDLASSSKNTPAVEGTGAAGSVLGHEGVGVKGTGAGAGAGVMGTGGSGAGGGFGVGAGLYGVGGGAGSPGAIGIATDDGNGVEGIGEGTGHGVVGVAGATGVGVRGTGGATSGPGVKGTASAGNGSGVEGTGHGTGAGVEGTGAVGVRGEGSATGVKGEGPIGVEGVVDSASTNGDGVKGTGKGTGAGVHGLGGGTDGVGVRGTGIGSGRGVIGQADAGPGIGGGSVSGPGVYGESQLGPGGEFKANGLRGAINILFNDNAGANKPAGANGDMYVSAEGKLWVFAGGGWKQATLTT